MSINLWKLAGKPTSYNPLELAYPTSQRAMLQSGEKVLRFKAKSASKGSVTLYLESSGISKILNLTTQFAEYEYSFMSKNEQFYFITAVANDIIIENIELVHKPLPKLTINGIDGFKSGKWNLHTNAKAIDNETLELNATGNGNTSKFVLDIIPNTPYVISFENLNGRFFLELQASDNSYVGTYYNISSNVYTFTTHKSAVKLTIGLYNDVLGVGKFTFKKPMLNMGSVPAPYEKKKGERMVLPVPKKNLWVQGTIETAQSAWIGYGINGTWDKNSFLLDKPFSAISNSLSVVKGNSYVISFDGFSNVPFKININGTSYDYSDLLTRKSIFFVASSSVLKVAVSVGNQTNPNILVTNIQLEQGTTATAYEPYAVQVNKKPMWYVPKKNLIPSFKQFNSISAESTIISDIELLTNATVSHRQSTILVPVKPNTTYSYSGYTDNGYVHIYERTSRTSADGNLIVNIQQKKNFVTSTTTTYLNILFGSDFAKPFVHKNPQLEEGSTVTTYEPYQLVLPKARTGLRFEGDSYVQLPSMTMDAIEIECLISSKSIGDFLLDARSGLVNGYVSGASGSGWASIYVNGSLKAEVRSTVIPKDERVRILVKSLNAFTDDVTIFNNVSNTTQKTIATLYRVTCYLNGQVVAQYDFENPNNIVGDKVLQSANINVNKVSKNIFDKTKSTLGKYINVTGWLADSGTSDVSDYMPVEAGASYIVTGYANGANTPYAWFDDRKGEVSLSGGTSVWEAITAPSNAKYLRITVPKTNADTFMVEKGTVRTAYEPYYKIVENVVPNTKNLIPSFEDPRWNLHSNFKVLGPNVGRLDAITQSNSYLDTNIVVGKTYRFYCSGLGEIRVYEDKNIANYFKGVTLKNDTQFIEWVSTTGFAYIRLTNMNNPGTFDFFKPQLYELTGKEATIVGKPIPQRKASKRSLYAKR